MSGNMRQTLAETYFAANIFIARDDYDYKHFKISSTVFPSIQTVCDARFGRARFNFVTETKSLFRATSGTNGSDSFFQFQQRAGTGHKPQASIGVVR
jgi:hypothetical protein